MLCNVPNTVGYTRLVLLLAALCTGTAAASISFWLFLINLSLDYIDGVLARKLNQVYFPVQALVRELAPSLRQT